MFGFFLFINRRENEKAVAQVTALPALPTLSSDFDHGRETERRGDEVRGCSYYPGGRYQYYLLFKFILMHSS